MNYIFRNEKQTIYVKEENMKFYIRHISQFEYNCKLGKLRRNGSSSSRKIEMKHKSI